MPSAPEHVEVLVCGGGSAGIVAAIQAARAGAATLLIDANGILGGTTTAAGVNFPGLFHAEGRQVIAGIGWELVTRAVAEGGAKLPDFTDPQTGRTRHWLHHVRMDRTLFAALAEQAFSDAGGQLLLHTMLGAAEPPARPGEKWRVTLCCKEGLRSITADVLIDATGDANAAGMAGFARIRHEPGQPGTQMLRLTDYCIDEIDLPALQHAFNDAVAAGELLPGDCGSTHGDMERVLLLRGESTNHIVGATGDTSRHQTEANIAGRKYARRFLAFLRRHRGLEQVRLEWCADVCGIRQGMTIVGQSHVTIDDYRSGRIWPDAVCNSYYPTDLHRPDGASGTHIEPMPPGIVATIPRGAMLPRGSRQLLVAGQCIAGDQLAHSAYRVQATCMAVGQAAGAIAALSVETGTDCDQVPMPPLHALLQRHDAILPAHSRDAAAPRP